jgi:hypothetical protein
MSTAERIETACRAWWDRHANRKWDECPEEWKPFYRESMEAALAALPACEDIPPKILCGDLSTAFSYGPEPVVWPRLPNTQDHRAVPAPVRPEVGPETLPKGEA